MKTMNSRSAMKLLSITALSLFLFVTSCKDQDTISFSADDNSNLQSEASADAQMEDMSDLANVAMLADAGTTTGSRSGDGSRIIGGLIDDTRFSCAIVTLEFAADNNPLNPAEIHGYIVIDFGTGCEGPNGRIRKGKINIEFMGRRYIPGSFITITTDGYSIDGIQIDGTRTELNASTSTELAPKFTITEDVTVTFLDASTATRISTRTRTWNRMPNPLEDTWTVTGNASGTTRRGHDYVMTITKALVFKRACAISSKMVIPVEGTKELIVNDKKITTDFGTGSCDTTITITINGQSKDITVSANGD
jgi:hypothetical protein